jgi:hypothetical protein
VAKRVVRCRDWLKTRWAGKGSYVNERIGEKRGGRKGEKQQLFVKNKASGTGSRVVTSH